MAVSEETGTFVRSAGDEEIDSALVAANFESEAWRRWPNECGFTNLDEHKGPLPLKVSGHIPPYAAGSLYRTGPGISQLQTDSGKTHYVSHWFDGFAQSHKFDIHLPVGSDSAGPGATSCNVSYSSRLQSEDYIKRVREKDWRASISFAQRSDPCVGLFAKAMAVFEPKRVNNNVVVVPNIPQLSAQTPSPEAPVAQSNATTKPSHRNGTRNMFITTDNATMQQIDPDSLEPIGPTHHSHLHPELRGPMSCAHPQRDPETGDFFNYNLELGRTPTYRVFRTNADSNTTDILATFSGTSFPPAYIHSFFLTQNFVVLCIPSTHFTWNGLSIVWKRNLVEAMRPFDASVLSQWLVIDRRKDQGIVARFTTPAGFFFHSINAFEETTADQSGHDVTNINLDSVLFDHSDIISAFYYDVILDRHDAFRNFWLDKKQYQRCQPRLVRYQYQMSGCYDQPPLKTLTASTDDSHNVGRGKEVLSIPAPHVGELPTINQLFSTRAYRYVYSLPSRGLSTLMDCIAKTDLITRETIIWSGGPGHSPGEPVFIPKPRAQTHSLHHSLDEDDGLIVSVVLDGFKKVSYLVCLDARNLEELGRAEADFAVGLGFHGTHESAR